MIIPAFYGVTKKRTPYQGVRQAGSAHPGTYATPRRWRQEAALLPEEMTGQPSRGHDPCPVPVLLAAVPGDVGLARGLIAMNGKVVGAALAEVYCTVALGLGLPLLVSATGLADVYDQLLFT